MPTLQIHDLERQHGAVVAPRVVLPMLGEHAIRASMRRPVIRTFRIPFLALLAMGLLSTPGIACRPAPPSETVLLETLPAEAEGSAVIARVVVIDVYHEPPGDVPRAYATARVIEATKGVEVGQVIRIKN
ncbi:hypothetical protein MKK50_22260 [Methylobacterium sp. J-043]|nr:hypothetical protein [Methylobacterium sp. J-043]